MGADPLGRISGYPPWHATDLLDGVVSEGRAPLTGRWMDRPDGSDTVVSGWRARLRRAGLGLAVAMTLIVTGCGAAVPLAKSPQVLGVVGAPVIAQTSATIGVADSDLYGVPAARMNSMLAQVKSAGAGSVRIMIPWAGVERTRHVYDWSVVDAMVDAALAQRLSVLATLNSTPVWATEPGLPPLSGRPASAADFGAFAGTVAAHFRGRVSAYEIWNEPNAALFFAPVPNAGRYVELLKSAHRAIKAADSSALVVTGGLGPLVNSGTIAINAVRFVREMYAAGAKGSFDAIGYHPYQYTMKFSEGDYHPDSPLNQVVGIRDVMVANGDAAKKIWATEYGQPTSVAGDDGQAAYLDDMLRRWRAIPFGGPVYVYTARDRNSQSHEPDDTLGIYRSDGTAKPAEGVLRARASQQGILVKEAGSAPR